MAKEILISGTQQVFNNIMMHKNAAIGKAAVVIEKTCVDVANHAKRGHEKEHAHADARYQNRTGTLTRSITPTLEKVSHVEVSGVVFTNVEYAPQVELGGNGRRPYPFLFPALIANAKKYEERMRGVV